MQLSAIRTAARTFLVDPNAVRWTDAQLNTFINDGNRDFIIKTELLGTQSAALSVNALTPANAFYTLPVDLVELRRVEWNGLRILRANVDEMPWNWQTMTGQPIYYLFGKDFGPGLLRVYPYPNAVLTGLKVFYLQSPAALVGDTDTPLMPAFYHQALVWYCVAQAYMLDAQAKDPSKAQFFLQQYADLLADAQARTARDADQSSRGVGYRYL